MFTVIAFVMSMFVAFAVGIACGIWATCKSIASGKVKNVRVIG